MVPACSQKEKHVSAYFFPLAFIGKETSILNSPILLCPFAMCNSFAQHSPSEQWPHSFLFFAEHIWELRRCHWVFYLLMFMRVISTLSATGRHSTSHFEMQCSVWTQSSDAGKKLLRQSVGEKGAWRAERERFKSVSNGSEFCLD